MENNITPTPAPMGNSVPTEPQATPSIPQGTSEPQIGAPTPVDSGGQQPASQEPDRPKASDFVHQRRISRALAETQKQNQLLMQKLSELEEKFTSGSVPKPTDDSYNLFWNDPYKYSVEQGKSLEKKISEGLQKIAEQQQASVRKMQEQEALEILFPNDPSNPSDNIEERASRNLPRAETIKAIIEEHELQTLWASNPKKAAKLIARLVEAARPNNPAAPTKAQLAATPTGSLPRGASGVKSFQELSKERDALIEKSNQVPGYRQSEEFGKKLKALVEDMNKLRQ